MGDFVIIDREYPRLAELLVEHAPSFGASDEFLQLERQDLELPSVVCGAFRRFVERVHVQAAGEAPAQEAVEAMERMASSQDPEVHNYLIVDVFEHLDLHGDLLERFVARLGPAARSLYDKWIGPSGAGPA